MNATYDQSAKIIELLTTLVEQTRRRGEWVDKPHPGSEGKWRCFCTRGGGTVWEGLNDTCEKCGALRPEYRKPPRLAEVRTVVVDAKDDEDPAP